MFNLSAMLKKYDTDDNVSINTNSLRAVSQKADTDKVIIHNSMGVQNHTPSEDTDQKKKYDNDPWAGIMPMFG